MRAVLRAVLSALLLLVPGAAGAEPGPDALRRGIEAVVSRRSFLPAQWGIEVRGLRSGKVLYSLNAEKNLKPASTLKLVTTAAALHAFGPDVRLRTTVESAGRVDALGRLLGDLFLVGRGDPSLSGRFNEGRLLGGLEALADALRAAGVRRIEGRLVGHEGAFTGDRRGSDWGWEDLVWSYGAEVSALNFADNTARLRLLPGERAGDPAFLEVEPWSRHFSVTSTAATAAPGTKTELTLTEPLPNVFKLSGVIALLDKPWEGTVAVHDPALYAATAFAAVLEARGIRATGGVVASSEPLPASGLRVFAVHESPPLAELVKVVNKESQNLHAEILLRLLGLQASGAGSVEAGQAAVQQFLKQVGVPSESWGLQDGSGLSRSDVLTARGLVALLVAMDKHPQARAFRESLAEPGEKGTLENRLKSLSGRIQAKTGTLRQANALAGYLTGADGDRLAFALLVNHHTVPGREAVAALDDIVGVLAGR